MNEFGFFLKLALIICISIVTVVAIGTSGCVYHYHNLVENGYEQQMVPGSHYPVWVKREEVK